MSMFQKLKHRSLEAKMGLEALGSLQQAIFRLSIPKSKVLVLWTNKNPLSLPSSALPSDHQCPHHPSAKQAWACKSRGSTKWWWSKRKFFDQKDSTPSKHNKNLRWIYSSQQLLLHLLPFSEEWVRCCVDVVKIVCVRTGIRFLRLLHQLAEEHLQG